MSNKWFGCPFVSAVPKLKGHILVASVYNNENPREDEVIARLFGNESNRVYASYAGLMCPVDIRERFSKNAMPSHVAGDSLAMTSILPSDRVMIFSSQEFFNIIGVDTGLSVTDKDMKDQLNVLSSVMTVSDMLSRSYDCGPFCYCDPRIISEKNNLIDYPYWAVTKIEKANSDVFYSMRPIYVRTIPSIKGLRNSPYLPVNVARRIVASRYTFNGNGDMTPILKKTMSEFDFNTAPYDKCFVSAPYDRFSFSNVSALLLRAFDNYCGGVDIASCPAYVSTDNKADANLLGKREIADSITYNIFADYKGMLDCRATDKKSLMKIELNSTYGKGGAGSMGVLYCMFKAVFNYNKKLVVTDFRMKGISASQ